MIDAPSAGVILQSLHIESAHRGDWSATCNCSDWVRQRCNCWSRIRGRDGGGTGHDGLVAENQPNWKDLNRAQCRGHYWIMRAVQGHSAHFTAHLGIIVAWKENLEVTVHSSINISEKYPGIKFRLKCLKISSNWFSCPSFFYLYLKIFSVLSYSAITSCSTGDPSKRWRFPLKERDVVTGRPITAHLLR